MEQAADLLRLGVELIGEVHPPHVGDPKVPAALCEDIRGHAYLVAECNVLLDDEYGEPASG